MGREGGLRQSGPSRTLPGPEGPLGLGRRFRPPPWEQKQLGVEEHLAPKAFLGTTETLPVEHGMIGLEETFLRGFDGGNWKFAKEILL